MGAGTREADRLAEQQNEGPFLTLFDTGGGDFMCPMLVDTLEEVDAHVKNAQKFSDGNVTVRSIKLSKVLAASELVDALKGMIEDEELMEQDEHITACQCLSKAPDDLTAPGPCNYCRGKLALELAGEKV